ncbi:MAG: alpha/beta fold hydrolase [Alphaproteobacteria bacterium]|nr:alpha/beta fold hydrolase [Alphaproteobacteria bacterium]
MTSGYTLYGRPGPVFEPFRSTYPWVGGDLQTVRNTLSWLPPNFDTKRQERLIFPMNDGTGDSLLGLLDKPIHPTDLPLLILVHGLTGCEASRNIMVSAAHFVSLGFPVLRLNLRGAGPSVGLCREQYHAGRTQDLATVLLDIPDTLKRNGCAIVGVSLGGNMLLKFASDDAESFGVRAVASVSAPIDLKAAQKRIMAPRNFVYHRYLLNRMKSDALALPHDKAVTAQTLDQVRSVYDYDDLIIAPRNGFDGAEDYYAKCSANSVLGTITVPTLLIHAKTDPWIPLSMYLDNSWPADGPLTLIISVDGGHVGFHGAGSPVPWHDRCIGRYFIDLFAA